MSEIEILPLDVDRREFDRRHVEDITASIAACLWGDVMTTTSAYQEWAVRSGLWSKPPIDPKLAKRAKFVEDASPWLVQLERPDWHVFKNDFYFRNPAEKTGATPDLIAIRPDISGKGNIQVKSVGVQALRRWRDPDTGETALPPWIGIQVNVECGHMPDVTWACVAAITIGDHGLDIQLIDVDIIPALFEAFRGLAKEFWRRVRDKDPYPIDYGRDAQVILDMYRDDDGSTVDLTGDPEFTVALMQREQFKQLEREGEWAAKKRKPLDALILHKMGNAATARFGSAIIKAPTIPVKESYHKAYKYRRITVTGYEASGNPGSSGAASAAGKAH